MKKFLLDPIYLAAIKEVELLLTYEILRKVVQPNAEELFQRYGDNAQVPGNQFQT